MAYKEIGNRERSFRICFYLSDEELKIFNNKFENYKSDNRSEFIRESIFNSVIIINDDSNLRRLIMEVNRIGTNINQIAKIANTDERISKESINDLHKKIDDIEDITYKTLINHNKKRGDY